MSQIDTSQWKDIPLNQLFNVVRSKSIDKRYLSFVDKSTNTIEFIGRTSINNGIQGYVLKDSVNFEPNPSNSLSIIQIGHNWATWHDRPWYAAQNIFCLIPKKDQVYEHNVHMFLQSVINKKLQQYQGFTTYPKVTDIKKMTLKLPVDKNDDPDWQYMDTYIAKLTTLAHKNVSSLATLKPVEHKIDIKAWKKFKVGELFDVDTGVSVPKLDLDANPGNTPRISVTNENNGVIGYYDDKADLPNIRYFTNFISVNFFGKAFYHPSKASVEMKVHVLKLKDREFTPKLALFFTSILNKYFSKDDYGYGNQLSSSKLKSSMYQIPLPVTSTGQPDFDYMEKYIDNVQNEAHESLELLNNDHLARSSKNRLKQTLLLT